VVGTVEDNGLSVSIQVAGDDGRSLSCVVVVKGYNKRYGTALIQLKLIEFNAKGKGTFVTKEEF
jgi:hypothetical protein